MSTMQRRLAAIVHADLAGFTRMMEGPRRALSGHLKAAQIDVWRPAIDSGGGRLVGTAGDAMLAEFASAVSAVSAAIDIQERMASSTKRYDISACCSGSVSTWAKSSSTRRIRTSLATA